MARRPFSTPGALIVVSTEGYFDVYPPAPRQPHDKPAYRGTLAELGPSVRGADDRLSVRPDSAVLDQAVCDWSRLHGHDAVSGAMGHGRDGAQ